ncbi:MAG: hypothetical protein HY261_06680 [Chloroflexi bacterium]|nr:hypothetical protein [Chloroflexota bacterium]
MSSQRPLVLALLVLSTVLLLTGFGFFGAVFVSGEYHPAWLTIGALCEGGMAVALLTALTLSMEPKR